MTPADYAAAVELIQHTFAAERPRAYLAPGEFEHRWRTVYPPGSTPPARLWRASGMPAGFAWCDGPFVLTVNLPGRYDLEDAICAWAEATLAERDDGVLALAFESDERRLNLLRRRGYAPTPRGTVLRDVCWQTRCRNHRCRRATRYVTSSTRRTSLPERPSTSVLTRPNGCHRNCTLPSPAR